MLNTSVDSQLPLINDDIILSMLIVDDVESIAYTERYTTESHK